MAWPQLCVLGGNRTKAIPQSELKPDRKQQWQGRDGQRQEGAGSTGSSGGQAPRREQVPGRAGTGGVGGWNRQQEFGQI